MLSLSWWQGRGVFILQLGVLSKKANVDRDAVDEKLRRADVKNVRWKPGMHVLQDTEPVVAVYESVEVVAESSSSLAVAVSAETAGLGEALWNDAIPAFVRFGTGRWLKRSTETLLR
eukprot:350291-Amphidinium_carterae.2